MLFDVLARWILILVRIKPAQQLETQSTFASEVLETKMSVTPRRHHSGSLTQSQIRRMVTEKRECQHRQVSIFFLFSNKFWISILKSLHLLSVAGARIIRKPSYWISTCKSGKHEQLIHLRRILPVRQPCITMVLFSFLADGLTVVHLTTTHQQLHVTSNQLTSGRNWAIYKVQELIQQRFQFRATRF